VIAHRFVIPHRSVIADRFVIAHRSVIADRFVIAHRSVIAHGNVAPHVSEGTFLRPERPAILDQCLKLTLDQYNAWLASGCALRARSRSWRLF
jgi:carbonic anhydrase/acetyltransferase-like protein (isoleucine patch superfamily)